MFSEREREREKKKGGWGEESGTEKGKKKLTRQLSRTLETKCNSSKHPGFYVILDWHPVDEPEPAAQQDSFLVSHDRALANDWKALAAALASLPAWKDGRLKGRVLLEPINEPDRLGMAWNVASKGRLNVTAAAEEAARSPSSSMKKRKKRGSQVVVVEEATVAAASAAAAPSGRKLLQQEQQQQQQQQTAANSFTLPESDEIVFIDPRDGSVATSEVSLASTEVPASSGVARQRKKAARNPALVGVSRADLSRGTFNLTQRPLASLLLDSAKAIHSVLGDPALLILEGTNQSYWMPPLSWGGAFITDPAVAADHEKQNRKYSDAAPFFEALQAAPEIAARVALGPHVYGPSIGWSAEQTRGPALWKTLSLAFGEKSAFGRKFPVIVTEFGTRLDGGDRAKIQDDLTWLTDFAKWANAWPETGNTRRVRGWCWWQWSPSVSFFDFFFFEFLCRCFFFSSLSLLLLSHPPLVSFPFFHPLKIH